MQEEKPNIYHRINAVMKECEYLQKKRANQGKGIKYDEVIAMIRDLLINNGIVMVTRQLSFEQSGQIGNGNQKLYQGEYELDLVNIDNPSEVVTHKAFAQGMDGGDKAAGKAHTYAMKMMLVKGFGIETGEDEESRAEKLERESKLIDDSQLNHLLYLCSDDGGETVNKTGAALLKAYKIDGLNLLPELKFTEALNRAKRHANN